MSRFLAHDSDTQRLPEGMHRVGYDADTQRYTFKDTDGSYWHGEEGSTYGPLKRAQTNPTRQKPKKLSANPPAYRERTGCTRTSPNAPCSCYVCAVSTTEPAPADLPQRTQSVVKKLARSMSVRKNLSFQRRGTL